jgi:hypothetical protein
MIIQHNFTTIQLAPIGAARVAGVNLFIDVDDLPECTRSIQHGGGLVVYYGTDGDQIASGGLAGMKALVVCPASAKIDKAVKAAQKAGRFVLRVFPDDVKESTLYSVDYDQTLWMQVGGGDVVPAVSDEPKGKGKKRAPKGDDEALESSES